MYRLKSLRYANGRETVMKTDRQLLFRLGAERWADNVTKYKYSVTNVQPPIVGWIFGNDLAKERLGI